MLERPGVWKTRRWNSWLLSALTALVLAACEPKEAPDTGSTPAEPEEEPFVLRGDGDYVEFPIFWATDRKQTDATAPADMFGGERGPLIYGTSTVSVPHDHKVGEIERPEFWRIIFGGEDPSRHMVLLQDGTDILEEDPWFQEVRTRSEAGGRTAFVFIHGFNTTFEEAALRTAQIGYDLEFPGAPILYSWPSQGSSTAYTVDENNVSWSEANLIEFLEDIRERSGADDITLIAHSMGGRLLGNALKTLSRDPSMAGDPPFNEIILSAPDIDADVFKTQIMPAMLELSRGRTLYASSEDWALALARRFLRGGKPRAGESGEQIVVMPDLETIDATDVRTDFWRHDDVSNRPVLTDMRDIIRDGKRADDRDYLKRQETDSGPFWQLRP